jgi:hypothetical protein
MHKHFMGAELSNATNNSSNLRLSGYDDYDQQQRWSSNYEASSKKHY